MSWQGRDADPPELCFLHIEDRIGGSDAVQGATYGAVAGGCEKCGLARVKKRTKRRQPRPWLVEKKLSESAATPADDTGEVILPASWGDISDKHDDFDKVIRGDHPVTKTMTEQMFSMEAEGSEVAYYLGKNPDEAKRIASVSGEIAVARELAKLVGRTTVGKPKGDGDQPGNGQAANVAPTVSTAPEPLTRTPGGGAQARQVDLNTTDPEEFRAIRREQMKARG